MVRMMVRSIRQCWKSTICKGSSRQEMAGRFSESAGVARPRLMLYNDQLMTMEEFLDIPTFIRRKNSGYGVQGAMEY